MNEENYHQISVSKEASEEVQAAFAELVKEALPPFEDRYVVKMRETNEEKRLKLSEQWARFDLEELAHFMRGGVSMIEANAGFPFSGLNVHKMQPEEFTKWADDALKKRDEGE